MLVDTNYHHCSVKDIVHERTWLKGSIYDVEVSNIPYLHMYSRASDKVPTCTCTVEPLIKYLPAHVQ